MSDENGRVIYHYAACNDCPQFMWVESSAKATIEALKHQNERNHDATSGSVPENVIESRSQSTESYNGE